MKTIRNLVGAMALLTFTAVSATDAATAIREVPATTPFFITKGEKVLLNYLNVEMVDVRIKVIDRTGRVLYWEVIEDEMVVEKAFNFENAYQGEYRVVVEQNGEKFIKKIRV